jgi:hypothetical protein
MLEDSRNIVLKGEDEDHGVVVWLAASSRPIAPPTAGVFWKAGTRRRPRYSMSRAPVSWSSEPIDVSKLPNIYPAVILL